MGQRVNFEEYVCTPQALKGCLDYLYRQAMIAGMRLPAHFIGAAAEATSEIIEKQEAQSDQPPAHDDQPYKRAVGDW